MHPKNSRTRTQHGFSLVELLVVITIMGVLASVVVFAVSGITDKGQTSVCTTDAQTLRTAIEAYRAKNPTITNPTEAQLVTAGLLGAQSTLHNIAYGANNTYTITNVAPC